MEPPRVKGWQLLIIDPYSNPFLDLADTTIDIYEYVTVGDKKFPIYRYTERVEYFAEDSENFIVFNFMDKQWFHKNRWTYKLHGEQPYRFNIKAMFGFKQLEEHIKDVIKRME
jgi:hypothetical protein